jgi:hypothetical protein
MNDKLHPVFFAICENIKRGAIAPRPTEPIPPAVEHPLFGPVIYSYTRAQAIEDGVLVNLGMFVSEGRPVLELVGIRFPVALTAAAYGLVMGEGEGPELLLTDVITRRVLYFLAVLKRAVLAHRGDPTIIEFTCTNADLKPIALKAICGPGDNGEPVITVMLPLED